MMHLSHPSIRPALTIAICLLLLWGMHPAPLYAQQAVQEIHGRVEDGDTYRPIANARVTLKEIAGAESRTDSTGAFAFTDLPVGRYTALVEAKGYYSYRSPSILLQGGKEQFLAVNLMGNIDYETVTTEYASSGAEITAAVNPAQPVNEMLVVSTRSFNIDQVQRFPATIADPGRMAMTFAGVAPDRDFNSDIVVRGNAPAGVQWRLEGVEIANPNHFGRIGSSGGGLTIFSVSLLGQSDFSTGAFAPEYGNALSGVFDMHFRSGNMDKREHTVRVGLMGLDVATEGPIQRGKSSYLINYRYSTLGLLNRMGFRLVNERTENTFTDLSFNLSFKVKDNGRLTVFGTGGQSTEEVFATKDSTEWLVKSPQTGFIVGRNTLAFTENYFFTQTGATGLTYTHLLGQKAYFKAVAALTASHIIFDIDTLNPLNGQPGSRITSDRHTLGRGVVSLLYNRKVSAALSIRTGVYISHLTYNLTSILTEDTVPGLVTKVAGQGATQQYQPYAQGRWRISQAWTLSGGVHANLLALNQAGALEPRMAINYDPRPQTALSLAYGLHSQMLPLGSYFTVLPDGTHPNHDLPLMQSHHLVAAFNQMFGSNYRLRIEAYRQWINHLPVAADSSSYMPLNERTGYATKALSPNGQGNNIGVDVTFERFFSKGWFFLFSGSVYHSTYTDLQGRTFNTRYNGNYNTSLMIAREWKLGSDDILETTLRAMTNGGLRYTPADSLRSAQARVLITTDSLAYSAQVPAYFRVDARLAWRHSSPKKVSFTLAADVQNVTNQKNYSNILFNANFGGVLPGTVNAEDLRTYYLRPQAGLVPVISFQIDF